MTNDPSLLSELTFGAFLQYSPRGQREISRQSRQWRDAVKYDSPGSMQRVSLGLARNESARSRGLLDLLNDALLVPTPRSAPLRAGALWPAHRICEELVAVGLGRTIAACLERTKPVQKSAFAAKGKRPTVRTHLESIAASEVMLPAGDLVIVDDFVTKGATLLAVASLLLHAYPNRSVRAFALVRTMGLIPEINALAAPCMGTIRLIGDDEIDREPSR